MKLKAVNDIVNFIIETELEQFKQDFDEDLIPNSQDISSLSIAWLCHNCKDNVSQENLKTILNFVDDVMNRENYHHHGWLRIPALQAALFALTGENYYLNDLLQHVSCAQSASRGFIIQCVSIIIELIDFENDCLKESVEFNISHNHGYADESILLLLGTKSGVEETKEWIKSQLELKNTNSTELLKNLLDNNFVIKNDFYKNIFNEVKNHILFRILKHSYSYNGQTNLFDSTRKVHPKTLNSFKDNHPLDKTSFRFKFNAE